jgi:hypothetical protein
MTGEGLGTIPYSDIFLRNATKKKRGKRRRKRQL